MKIKRNVEPKKWVKGKCYCDYVQDEVKKGNWTKKDATFWLNVNEQVKKDPTYTVFHFYTQERKFTKQIPYNS